ncbi:VOC family protein [Pacificimonas flava]|uniref:VOC domain-containing protein n=1 Tax=Pacificimonas flava TaxID=1234595 RepID=M2U412_9SPHN|nr:VOC family protein [Pacificimonas flava]EMD82713.1 hypothetical protein C725_1753 [Pacificimonas flava]MBB5279332.1 catechol 2,3-dioxygenase-like lactoylglutathione lyase family enzyme [Pacificimonas flava]
MTLLRIDHVQLAMPAGGEDAARAFFADLLGMAEVPKPETLSPEGCWFAAGTVQIHIGSDPDFRPARRAHPALCVEALDALAATLGAAGHSPEWDDRLPGVRRFFASDPFGNRIEFMESGGD